MIDGNVLDDEGGPLTSLSLLVRIQSMQPDALAWARFDNLYRPLVCGWCVKGGLQNADADDVCQEVFRRVHQAIGRFRWERGGGTLRGWLRIITSNAISEWGRRKKKIDLVSGQAGDDAQVWLLAVPDPTPEEPDEQRDRDEERLLLREALRQILAGFKEQTREAFWRVVIDQRNPAEVATELGVEVHVVYLAKSRVLKRLKDEYGDLVDLKRL
ncbi:sigma-70 family RNA polymerase sigma factor [Zavarzinella formosa]|uniref:sigma-70 family RNA polymerase sigma factor n=1 Tax=Zavarzinella formosa TaxID=360055 RepID=UPI000313CF15|nr:sigma-70 family RNA polymerase sigma factor [Zavarzinella formosa]